MRTQKVIVNQQLILIEGCYYCLTDQQAKEGIEAGMPIQHIPIEKEVRLCNKPL
jgi:hypothetical protein